MPDEQRPHFSHQPLLWLSITFALGIVVASFWELSLELLIGIAAALSLAAALTRGYLATLLVLVCFFVVGAICYNVELLGVSHDRISVMYDEGTLVSGKPVEVEGALIGMPEPAPDGYFITIDAAKLFAAGSEVPASGNLRLFLAVQTTEAHDDFLGLALAHGTRIRVACNLEREDRFLNPGVTSRIELLDRQGIDATATIKSPLLIEPMGRDQVFLPLAFVYERRASLIEGIRGRFTPSTTGVLIASMLGDQYFLDRNTADVFREGGTFHVLVISGLHITFIGGLIVLVVRQFSDKRKLQAIVSVSALWLYSIAVGGETPVIRACVMFTALMLGYAFYRSSTLFNALGSSALVLLVWRPTDLFDPSFQLTIVSIVAIVAFGLPLIEKFKAIGTWTPTATQPFPPNVADRLRRFCETIYWNAAVWNIERQRHVWTAQLFKSPYRIRLNVDEIGVRRILIFVFEGLVISLAVQVWLLPLLVFYFHRVSPASFVLNLWVGPILAIESIVALAAVGFGSFSDVLAIPFETLAEMLNWLLVTAPLIVTDRSWASIRVPVYSGQLKAIYLLYLLPVVVASVLALGWDPLAIRKTKQIFGPMITAVSIFVLGSLIVLHPLSAAPPNGRLHVDFLDVGQGDAALITFPNGETMLVDGGGRVSYNGEEEFEPDVPRIGEAVVSEILWERGLSQIDHVVATHADADHIQGLVDVSRNFRIGSAYMGRVETDPNLNELLTLWHQQGTPVTRLTSGGTFEISGVRIEVLHPPQGLPNTVSSNNVSIVLRLVFGETEILLTGDIEQPTEEVLVSSGHPLTSDVIKVPHHGSRTSSTEGFVNAVSPRLAIISVGKHSIFGHPHAEVVERWKAAGANVLTTGDGMVSISSDGREIEMSQYVRSK